MSWGVSPWVYPIWDSLSILDLGDYFLPHFREVFHKVNIKEKKKKRKKEKRIKRNEDNLRDLQDNMKHSNIRIIGVPEEEDKKKDHEKR